MTENLLMNTALMYASKYGWAVFPVDPNTKRPLTPHGCKDAKKTTGPIKAWWKKHPDAAIGVATGSISNLIVIDEDIDKDKGLDGYVEVTQWEREHGELPETVRAKTGRGGAHLYYFYSGNDINNRAGLLEGVDIRGEGGYVIAPPSKHPNGTEYEWEFDPEETKLAPVDERVMELLKVDRNSKSNRGLHHEKYEVPENIPSGKRNDVLHRLGSSLQAQGFSDDAILAVLKAENLSKCDVPLEDSEVELIFSSVTAYAKGESKVIRNCGLVQREPKFIYQVDKDGEQTDRIAQTIKNAEEAILYDKELFGRIAFNELSYAPTVYGNLPWRVHKGWRNWDNTDDSNLRCYLEAEYGLKTEKKIMDALNNVIHQRDINPVKDMLEGALEAWDGQENHIENLLTRFVGAKKTGYNIAVLKTFMLGAISRAYKPGCKFDYLIVLIGKQGGYKSSFLQFLAINNEWFADNFSSVDNDKAFEKIQGKWIIEMAELQALKRTRDDEAFKAFTTSPADNYRQPYERRAELRPRRCVFAGTTNNTNFLRDKTGNRRFLLVTCGEVETSNPYDDELATRSEFLQAWGEAMHLYKKAGGKPSLILPKEYEDEALEQQERYMEEDDKPGEIQAWLDGCGLDRVCASMIAEKVFGVVNIKDRRWLANEIHQIMENEIIGWQRLKKKMRCGGKGPQRVYERIEGFVNASDDMDEISFDD